MSSDGSSFPRRWRPWFVLVAALAAAGNGPVQGADVVVGAGAACLLAVRHALTPADREHRFGHGKAEALAGLGQSAFIAGSAGFLLLEMVLDLKLL